MQPGFSDRPITSPPCALCLTMSGGSVTRMQILIPQDNESVAAAEALRETGPDAGRTAERGRTEMTEQSARDAKSVAAIAMRTVIKGTLTAAGEMSADMMSMDEKPQRA